MDESQTQTQREAEQVALTRLTQRLTADYPEARDGERIAGLVEQARRRYAHARIRDFVPLLVERDVRQWLRPDVAPPAAVEGA